MDLRWARTSSVLETAWVFSSGGVGEVDVDLVRSYLPSGVRVCWRVRCCAVCAFRQKHAVLALKAPGAAIRAVFTAPKDGLDEGEKGTRKPDVGLFGILSLVAPRSLF